LQEKPATAERTIKLDSTVRVRFAPSPTGGLHVGSARTALFNWLFARHAGGVVVLRIDDTDVARSETRHEESILEDLRWLGLDWDEGPDTGGPVGPYRQSERLERYRAAAAALVASGHAYRCFCTEERLEALRAEQRAAGITPRYDRRCAALSREEAGRRLAAGEPAAVRFAVPAAEVAVDDTLRGIVTVGAGALGDFIILRSDGVAGYNFATAVDDAAMGITHVIRGDDHLTNTARQLLLLRALDAPPPRYAHHGMILDPEGGKLSKRHGATSVGEFRELGYLPQALVNYLALLSWSHGEEEILDRERLVAEFELERLSPSAAAFDRGKLDWLAHEHVMRLDPEEHARRFAARLPAGTPPQAAAALAAAAQPSLSAYGEAPAFAAAVLDAPVLDTTAVELVAGARVQLEHLAAARAAAAEWLDPAAAHALLVAYREWGAGRELSAKRLLMPLRAALTGREHGPELHYVLAALDRLTALDRLREALERAAGGLSPNSARSGAAASDPSSSTKGARP
jgi:glutamyl-tRNA synthetase